MYRTDDPIRDYDRWEIEQLNRYNRSVQNAPCCTWCGASVIDFDFVYDVNGDYICEDCIDSCKESTDKWWEL